MSHSHCDHGHEEDDNLEMGIRYSLYTQIDLNNVQCLNEAEDDSIKTIFKPWENRLTSECVESDVDAELLINIPFVSYIKLKGIIVIGGQGSTHPSKMRLFKNKEYMTFDDTGVPADQEFEMQHDINGSLEYSVPVVKFCSVNNLTIHFPTNFGGDKTIVYYIGLRGEYTAMKRHGVTLCTYESRPQIYDHKLREINNIPEIL